MPSNRLCGLFIGDEFVLPIRIGHPALDDGDTVLPEEQAIRAPDRLRRTGSEIARACSKTIWLERSKKEIDIFCDLFDMRQVSESICQSRSKARAWDIGGDDEVGWVGVGKIGRIERLGPPGTRYRAHCQTAKDGNEQDDGEISAPPATKCCSEAVPGDSKKNLVHGDALRRIRSLMPSIPDTLRRCLVQLV